MNSVIVTDVRMPKTCDDCAFEQNDENYYGDVMSHDCPFIYKGWTDKTRETGRLEDCPLKPVNCCETCKWLTDNVKDRNFRDGYCSRYEAGNFFKVSKDDYCSFWEDMTGEDS